MKDFFDRQEQARKKTIRLILLFVVAVILIISSVYVAITGIYYIGSASIPGKSASFAFWEPMRFMIIFMITLCVILGASVYKMSELTGGGYRIAEMLGGRKIVGNTSDFNEKRLMNVVEEMAVASGMPVPDVYVMDRESSINAFAAGFDFDDAVISITRGGLLLLNRDELQGVIAHEFSHILNSDTNINMHLMGWLHGILLLSLAGQGILRGLKYARGRGSAYIAALGVALLVLGSIGMFFGKLIKTAVSRQREYLADASSVQYTRNPSGLSGALKKIGGLSFGAVLKHPRAAEASHIYFSDGLGENWFALMETHPPLIKRIRRLDPSFDGIYPRIEAIPIAEPAVVAQVKADLKPDETAPKIYSAAAAVAILETIGSPLKEHADIARELLGELPAPVRTATKEVSGASTVIYLMLLNWHDTIREKQLTVLRESEASDIVREIEKLSPHFPTLSLRVRLPLLDLALPALRNLSADQYRMLKINIDSLIAADEKLSFFEYILRHILFSRLDAYHMKAEKKVAHIYSVRGVIRECSIVLSLLARLGRDNEEEAALAFSHGKRILREPKIDFAFLSAEDCTLKKLDKTFDTLARTSPVIKKKVLAACLECLMFDKTIMVKEVELFRAVVEALGCPIPPWLSFSQ
jgi:Zn-dependent protease with chaperone function